MPSPTDDETPFPALARSATFNAPTARSHLSPYDAFISPPRTVYRADGAADSRARLVRSGGERSRSRRRKRTWKKLMWVKQSYPDNYTDQATFLDNLQLNPRLKPYDFWPLVADSTVILQHVCSVIIFIVCFVGIFQERVSPVSVVSYSSFATLLGWILWERWVTAEEAVERAAETGLAASATGAIQGRTGSVRNRARAGSLRRPALLMAPSLSTTSTVVSSTSPPSAISSLPAKSNGPVNSSHKTSQTDPSQSSQGPGANPEHLPPGSIPFPEEESILDQRMGTIKSAILIYCTLLGLSPILKSLTRSTSSDSIWAISFWLLAINIFFFDYSGGVGAKFPASLSTNAALMASTVLASRLPSTKQVFSLTLFSIQVFGLFPVFRRHVRHRSFKYHVALAAFLVLGSGLGVGIVASDSETGKWPWKSGLLGMVIAVFIAVLATGGCSWWLIGLQKYKNEIRGPWDPARPIIMSRTRWEDK